MSEGDVGTGSKISHALTKKLGPLPGYAWVGLAVGGFIVWHKLHGGGSSSAGAVPAGTTDTTLGGTPGTLDSGSGGGGGGGTTDAGQGAGFFVDPNTALLEQELQQLLSAQSQQQTPNPNDNAPPAQPPPGQNVDVYGHPLSGGPIFAYSGGQLVGYNPSAQSAFSTHTPASAGYNALGVKPSDPITLLPTQLGPPDTGAPRLIPTSGAIPV